MSSPSTARARPDGASAFDTIHGDMLCQFSQLVRDLGGDPRDVARQAGIDLPDSSDIGRITYPQFVSLMEIAAADLSRPDFGLQLAVRQSPTAFISTLGDGMRNSRTFGDALRFASSHSYAHSLAAWIWLKPSLSGANTVVGHDILLEGLPQKSQAMEYILLVGNLATLRMTDGRVRARRVLFRHQPISPITSYRRYFGCEVRFGRSADAVVYSAEDLACPIISPDRTTCQSAAMAIETRFVRHRPPLHADVRGVVTHLLGIDACSEERVAGILKLHIRTMRRRLAEDGTSFRQIKEEVRRDRLLYYARDTDLEFTEISEKLGYSEQAAMTRFCRQVFAQSPTRLRGALRA